MKCEITYVVITITTLVPEAGTFVPGLGLGIGLGLRLGLGLWLCSLARKFTGKQVLRRESNLGTKVP